MPFCDIDHDVSLYYITNTPGGDVTDMDSSKPTIILLPPMFCDATLGVREQFKDSRLSQSYNLIAFDQRDMGLTRSSLCSKRDGWVDAADLAIAHELLRLPPCHIFSVGTNSGVAAQRFAALFPAKCLSLCLCAAPMQREDEPPELEQGFFETTYAWCFPKSLEDVERACLGISWYAFSAQISPELEDEIVAWWQMNLPPKKRTSFLAQTLGAANRSQLSDEEINAIKQPTIILQGDKSVISPPVTAQKFCNKLHNGRVCTIKGGPEYMNLIPEYSSIINRLYYHFLEELPIAVSIHKAIQPDPIKVCKAALAKLSVFAHDPSIANRDPSTPLSFSRLSSQEIEKISEKHAEYSDGEQDAFNALDENGLPIRKFSERHVNDWNLDVFQRHYLTSQVVVSRKTSIS